MPPAAPADSPEHSVPDDSLPDKRLIAALRNDGHKGRVPFVEIVTIRGMHHFTKASARDRTLPARGYTPCASMPSRSE